MPQSNYCHPPLNLCWQKPFFFSFCIVVVAPKNIDHLCLHYLRFGFDVVDNEWSISPHCIDGVNWKSDIDLWILMSGTPALCGYQFMQEGSFIRFHFQLWTVLKVLFCSHSPAILEHLADEDREWKCHPCISTRWMASMVPFWIIFL